MAKVVFALTDSQVRLLGQLRTVRRARSVDPRTFGSLRKLGLITSPESSRYASAYMDWQLTPAGEAAVQLCERLAILEPLRAGK